MTLDSSALLAILFSEAGHLELIDRILEADHVRVGSPTLVETVLVLADGVRGCQRRQPLTRWSRSWVSRWPRSANAIRGGNRCFPPLWPRPASGEPQLRRLPVVGTAAAANDSLLFVGADFARTDIPRA